MSRAKLGSKTGRRERHMARQAAVKAAKKKRRERAAIHGAMGEAERIRKARKKGRGEFDSLMESLGFSPLLAPRVGEKPRRIGREIPGDVTAKYEAIR